MKFSIVNKLSLGAVLLVLTSTVMIGGLFYFKTSELLVENELKDFSARINAASKRILSHVEAQSADVLFLSRIPPVQGMIRALKADDYDRKGMSTYQSWVSRQESIFTTMLESKPAYLALRFIDKNGQELVVVSRKDNNIISLSNDQLQNKSHRDYVRETLKLSHKSVYISEINLNREHGKVSYPKQEVLRSATPIYDEETAEVAGILLITAEIGYELRKIQKNIQNVNREIFITNDRGGYLLHPDDSKAYGFDMGKHYRIQEDIPLLAEMFIPDNQQSHFTLLPEGNDNELVVNFTKVRFDPSNSQRFIAVGITERYGYIVAQQAGVLNDVVLLALLLVVVMALLGVIFSIRLTQPIKAITQIMDDYTHKRPSLITMPLNQNDEIGVMARSYESLMTQVEEAQANLEDMNRNLEVLVHQRTQALEMIEVRQRTILETIADAIITVDKQGIITSFNPAAEAIFGYTVAEVMGNNISLLMLESEWRNYANFCERSVPVISGVNQKNSLKGLRKDGSSFPLELNVASMKIDQEQGFVGIFRDITERNHAEQELNRFKSTLDETLDCVFMFDAETLKFFYVNAGGIDQVGYSYDELMGMSPIDIKPDFDEEHFREIIAPLMKGEQSTLSFETRHQHSDGHIIPVEVFVQYINLPGEPPRFVNIVRDITERKKTDKMKNEFISTVSHELRTPLTSIRASLGLISQGIVGKIPEEALEMLKIAGNNTERLLLLINDILDIQKIESGQMVFKFKNMSVMPLIKGVVEDNAGYAEQYGIEFVITNELKDARVFADKDRLMQVMANLLSNAAKFSREGGVVNISIARHDDALRISVTDHGSGIPIEFQPKLFDKFTQSDSSDTRQQEGTGLGLSISKVIVEKHGGLIDFISHEGIGATFYIELPELMGEYEGASSPRQLMLEHQPCILIVEDDPDVAALLKRMLAEAGYNSDIAYDVNEAKQLLKKNSRRYKAITLDLVLPGDNGIVLLDELHKDASTQNIPVVVVSVKANETKQDLKGGAIGVMDWLQKPIDQPRLIDAVKQAAGPIKLARVLHIEDEADVHKVVSVMLRDYCDLTWTTTVAASKEALETENFDLVLLDIGLPDGSGLDLLEVIEHRVTPPKVVIFSAYDVAQEYADKVNAVLVKSQSDNFRLAEVISNVINT